MPSPLEQPSGTGKSASKPLPSLNAQLRAGLPRVGAGLVVFIAALYLDQSRPEPWVSVAGVAGVVYSMYALFRFMPTVFGFLVTAPFIVWGLFFVGLAIFVVVTVLFGDKLRPLFEHPERITFRSGMAALGFVLFGGLVFVFKEAFKKAYAVSLLIVGVLLTTSGAINLVGFDPGSQPFLICLAGSYFIASGLEKLVALKNAR